MKKEFDALLKAEDATLRVNKYCTLHRWQNAMGLPVDKLTVSFNVIGTYEYAVDIESRDWIDIVGEIMEAQQIAFTRAAIDLNKNLSNGYLG